MVVNILSEDSRKAFNLVFNGETNAFTPYPLEYGETKNGIYYEISQSKTGETFGVTFIKGYEADSVCNIREIRQLYT